MLLWSANRVNGGYVWSYERAAVIPDSTHVCSLADPRRDLTAIVIEQTGFAHVTPAERAKGDRRGEHRRFGLEYQKEHTAGHSGRSRPSAKGKALTC